MKQPLSLLCALALTAGAASAYIPDSQYVQDPESILPYLIESADFWFPSYDEEVGGFFSEVNLTGQPTSNDKAILTQSRNAYAMVKAFMITGDETYLDYADGALRFMYEFGWDADNRGWWGQVDRDGDVVQPNQWFNDDWWSFWQHYMLLGIGHYVEATDEDFHWDWLDIGNEINDTELWDDTPGQQGYYDHSNWTWTNKSGKGFTPTVDAVTTNALQNYLLTRSDFRRERLEAVAGNIMDYLVAIMDDPDVQFGYIEERSTDWTVQKGNPNFSIGHFIKTGWCLARAYLTVGHTEYVDGLNKMYAQMNTETGMINEENGGPAGQGSWQTGAINDKNGDWWTVEQAYTGPIMAWYVTGNEDYLKVANDTIQFFMDEYYDHQNGEVYTVVSPEGSVIQAKKGDMFKGGYHSVELMYLNYLYGNLYYKMAPVSLYYRFSPIDEDRDIGLWPLAIEDRFLKIAAVEKDGADYAQFDPDARTVHVPANEGGIYKVTFVNTRGFDPFGYPVGEEEGWVEDTFAGDVYFNRGFQGWVYQQELGWMYPMGHHSESVWFYTPFPELGYIWATDVVGAPYFYSFAQGSWMAIVSETEGVIELWNYSTGDYVTINK